ncbi:MAG: TolC family protein [Salibacteraceae bacterium]
MKLAFRKPFASSNTWLLVLLLALMPIKFLQAQQTPVTLTFEEFMERVKNHHPMTFAAELQPLRGQATVRQARGAFDPKAYTDLDQKYFKDSEYWNLLDGGLKIPTWFGIEVKGGYEQNSGEFQNPELETPDAGLWYAGISVPIGQGLFIDQRRATLRQAQLFRQSTEAEQQQMMNELLLAAGAAYWEWFQAYHVLAIFDDAFLLADQRAAAVRVSAQLGDRPFIDTLEAGIQVQNRVLSQQKARLDLQNSAALLSVFLWQDGFVPVELAADTRPLSREQWASLPVDPNLFGQRDSLIVNHPMLLQSQLKLDQLRVEERWKREQLKPTLNLNYNALSEPVGGDPTTNYSVNNYKWGFGFSMPLLLRKERGGLQLTEIKVMEAELGLYQKNVDLSYKADIAFNEWRISLQQAQGFAQVVTDYAGLLRGERQRFQAGESSLFLVNRREVSYINAQVKLIEAMAKNQKAGLKTNYALGILNQ